jgi:hypothetical protein
MAPNTFSGQGSLSGLGSITSPTVYSLGDVGPGGGKIFYVAATPFASGPTLSSMATYLEAAPTTGTNAWTDVEVQWGPRYVSAGLAKNATAIGMGYQSTLGMVAASASLSYAGPKARAYRGPNNLSDWYLPSRDELLQVRSRQSNIGGIQAWYYWSSTEPEDGQYASGNIVGMQNSTNGASGKSNLRFIRPIRAF